MPWVIEAKIAVSIVCMLHFKLDTLLLKECGQFICLWFLCGLMMMGGYWIIVASITQANYRYQCRNDAIFVQCSLFK